MTLDETLAALERIKAKYGGDIQVYEVDYGLEVIDVYEIEPIVIKTTVTDEDYIVTFQYQD